MLNLITGTIKLLPAKFWVFFGAFLGLSTITTPIAISYLIVNSGGINYVTESKEIKILGKKAVAETQHSNKDLQKKLAQMDRQLNRLNGAKNIDQGLAIKEIKDSFDELKPTADKAIEDSEDLKDIFSETLE